MAYTMVEPAVCPAIVQLSLPLPVQVSAVGVTVSVNGANAAFTITGKANNKMRVRVLNPTTLFEFLK